MTPLKTFNQVVISLGKKPFAFWPEETGLGFVRDSKSAFLKLKNNLEAKELTDTHAYKIILALEKDILETSISEVSFIQHLDNLVEVYRLATLDEELSEFIGELESNINKAEAKLLEHHLSIENLQKKGKKMNAEEKNKKDLETIQRVGIFYVLEYTLQVLWEFQHIKDEDKKKLLEIGLKTKAGNLPAYLPLAEITETSIERVMEKAKKERTELFSKVFLRIIKLMKSPLFLKLINYTPFVGEVLLTRGAVSGKEGMRKLDSGERFNYVIAACSGIMGWLSAGAGYERMAGVEVAISYAMVNIDTIPVVLKNSAKLLENKSPKLARMMEAIGEYVLQKREELAGLASLMFKSPGIKTETQT